MDLGLHGRTAIVTGGSTGIGYAIADELCGNGVTVLICARTRGPLDDAVASLAAKHPGQVHAVQADVADAGDRERIVAAATELLGGVDILVNNAGGSFRTSIEEFDPERVIGDYTTKVVAAADLIARLLPAWDARGGGSVLNMLSIGAKAPLPHSVPTSLSRAAGLALTKILATELAPRSVRVNAICLGAVRTPQHLDRAHASGLGVDGYFERVAVDRGIPLGRVGEPSEIANVAVFLLSSAASFVTGAAVNVDGGQSPVG